MVRWMVHGGLLVFVDRGRHACCWSNSPVVECRGLSLQSMAESGRARVGARYADSLTGRSWCGVPTWLAASLRTTTTTTTKRVRSIVEGVGSAPLDKQSSACFMLGSKEGDGRRLADVARGHLAVFTHSPSVVGVCVRARVGVAESGHIGWLDPLPWPA